MIKRYSTLNNWPDTSGTNVQKITPTFNDSGTTLATQSNRFGRLILPFLFWRGSVRLGYVPLLNDTNAPSAYPVDSVLDIPKRRDKYASGMFHTQLDQPSFAEFPWTRPRLHLETMPTRIQDDFSIQILGQRSAEGQPLVANFWNQMLISAGDDFSLGPLSACPPLGYTAGTLRDPLDSLDDLNVSVATRSRVEKHIASIFGKTTKAPAL